jgi:hypothetical protein
VRATLIPLREHEVEYDYDERRADDEKARGDRH